MKDNKQIVEGKFILQTRKIAGDGNDEVLMELKDGDGNLIGQFNVKERISSIYKGELRLYGIYFYNGEVLGEPRLSTDDLAIYLSGRQSPALARTSFVIKDLYNSTPKPRILLQTDNNADGRGVTYEPYKIYHYYGNVINWENQKFSINQGYIKDIELIAMHGNPTFNYPAHNITISGGNQTTLNKHKHTGNVYIAANDDGDTYYNRVGIGIVTGQDISDKLEIIGGTAKLQGIRKEITTITADYKATKEDHILEIDASSNSVQIELLEPSDDNKGQEFVIDVYNANNTINLLAFSKDHFDVNTITDEGNNIFRYTLKGTFDILNVQVGDLIKTSNATNAENNGIWQVQSVGTNYVDITNANGIAEASDSPCELQLNVMNISDFVVNETRTYIAYSHRNSYKRIN